MRKSVSQQQENVNGVNANQRRDKMKYGRPIWRGMQGGAHVCQRSDEVKYGRPIGRGMQRDVHVCQRSDKVKYGRPIGQGMQREAHVCKRSKQHAENGVHNLNLLLLNHFSSNFVFVITYHAGRQIIERPCHLFSRVVHNSKLTTLPESQRRWQPSWQRILEARQIIERLAKDPVTLFHNMSLLLLVMHRRSEISPVASCLVHEEKLYFFDMFHKLKYIKQCNFVITFIQWKDDGWLRRGGWWSWLRRIRFYRQSPVGGGGGVLMTCLYHAMFLEVLMWCDSYMQLACLN
jgi:hypothetical protein